jgi:hypothetical protein
MDERIEALPAVPLAYETPPPIEKRSVIGPVMVLLIGFLLALLAGTTLIAVGYEPPRGSELALLIIGASILVLLVSLYLIVIAAQKLLR